MINSSLISLFKSLDKSEFERFEEFIHSPFHNKKTSVIHLFDYLKNSYPAYKDEIKLKKETVYEFMYPGKKFNYGVMKNLMYDLHKLGENYIAFLQFEKCKPDKYIFLLQEFLNRSLYTAAEKSFKQVAKLLEDDTHKEEYTALKQFQIEKLRYDFTYNISKSKIFHKDELSKISIRQDEYLNKFFMFESFEIYSYLLSYSNVRKRKFDFQFDDKIVQYFNNAAASNSPAILLRANILKLKHEPHNESVYENAKKLISKFGDYLKSDKDIAYNFFATTTSFCREMELRGHEEKYTREMFYLYKKMLELEVLSPINYFPLVIFRNILAVSIRLKEFDWVEDFFNEYKNKLSPDSVSLVEYNYRASLNFRKGNWEKSLEYLSKMRFADDPNKEYIKVLAIKNNFELKRFSELTDLFNTFKQFLLHNKNIHDRVRLSDTNFVKFTEKLTKLSLNAKKDEVSYLLNKIKKEEYVSSRSWLIEKAGELIK